MSGVCAQVEPVGHAEEVMGTVVSFVVVPGPTGEGSVLAAIAQACAEMQRLDAMFSTWKPASALSRLRRGELDPGASPTEIGVVLELCRYARQVSAGWFDPWAMPGGVDPSGLVKGWVAERALALIHQTDATGGLVNAGGDVTTFGIPAPGARWRVGLRHPWRPDALAGIVEPDAAVATSGIYERGPHLIDPHNGSPRCEAASATVTGPSLALADALATALAVAGAPLLPLLDDLPAYEGYLISPDGTENTTAGFCFAP